ncbi:helix-turn-helix transcriptional regulator [Streptomyces sedi]|uniref:LuxR family transcriptional regulator n=1 Tax=Streptomyces sedi TaxID=555059 RepID=A0A5C4UNE0_9ACTN|nr:AAA family ATPase [Streptomyces sedi]TNM25150.1 LuxR family transcriptional regulator [Streptomyces sedi]
MDKTATARTPTADPGPTLVGRETETAHLARHLTAHPPHDPVLVVEGAPGTGKSALLDLATSRARHAGHHVLRATGSEAETPLAYAGLHQLLRPVLARTDGLPARQRAALHAALGLTEPPAPPDPAHVSLALLTLLSDLARPAPLLLVVDDAPRVDPASLHALSFTTRRVDGEPVTLLLGSRTAAELPAFDTARQRLHLGPLSDTAALQLLDAQPRPPTGRTRARVLREAAGNPLALIELTRAATTRQPPRHTPHGPLPPTERLEALYARDARHLPPPTRHALLMLAAADTPDTPAATRGLPEPADPRWTPAEHAGLIRHHGATTTYRHPLARSAVYHAAPPAERARAHRALADLLHDQPDRHAWHLAAATTRPDTHVAAALERTADRARRRGGHEAAATALQRAAELSPHRADQARLLADAAHLAALTGQLAWVEHLVDEVRTRTDDPALLSRATLAAGRLMTAGPHHTAAFTALARVADDAARTGSPHLLDALAAAAVVRYYSGEESQRQRIEALLPTPPHPSAADARHAWTRAVSDPAHAAPLAPALPHLIARAEDDATSLTALAVVAWLLDETPLAARAFDAAHERWQAHGPLPAGLGCAAGWTYLEQGRWNEARLVAADITATASQNGLAHAEACARTLDATAAALLGQPADARAHAEHALTLVNPLESRSVTVLARRALGLAAVAEGDHETAYTHFRSAFTPHGDPLHYHLSHTLLAELTAAAVRQGHHATAAHVLERSARHLGTGMTARVRHLVHRGRALLAAPDDAEAHFQAALADETGEQWPFERAQLRLDYGEWLRRQRRIAEARLPLTEALHTFRRLGALPWTARAHTELRAAGIEPRPAAPGVLTGLTPQQQHIVRLAARGLTNREIGERMFLSPRTVGSHLYRVFPKLGVTTRTQLRDLVETAPIAHRATGAPAARPRGDGGPRT